MNDPVEIPVDSPSDGTSNSHGEWETFSGFDQYPAISQK